MRGLSFPKAHFASVPHDRKANFSDAPLIARSRSTAAMIGGEVHELGPGTVFYIPPAPHDSWVVGEEPYVSLHFLGADR